MTSCTIIAVNSLFMVSLNDWSSLKTWSEWPICQFSAQIYWVKDMFHLSVYEPSFLGLPNHYSNVEYAEPCQFRTHTHHCFFFLFFFRPSQNYHISAGKEPVTLELLTFLRIFCMRDCKCSQDSDMKVKFAVLNICIARLPLYKDHILGFPVVFFFFNSILFFPQFNENYNMNLHNNL